MTTAIRCIAHKEQYGLSLRCTRPHRHKGRHSWAVDEGFYPFGRLDPDNAVDQAIVRAWNNASPDKQRYPEEPGSPKV